MDSFSPITRRIVALGLPVLILLLLVQFVVAPLLEAIATTRGTLVASRAREAHLAAVASSPLSRPSTMPPGAVIGAPDRAAASRRLASDLATAAAASGLGLSRIAPVPRDRPALVAISLTGTGPEGAVAGFLSQVERGRPVIRFRNWRIRADADGKQPLVFDAEAEAAWLN